MKTEIKNISIADYYFGFLEHLNSESKLDLISRLSLSISKKKEESSSLNVLFGSYKSEESAEKIINELRSSRTFNRNTESF